MQSALALCYEGYNLNYTTIMSILERCYLMTSGFLNYVKDYHAIGQLNSCLCIINSV